MEKHTFGNEYGFQTRAVHTGNDIDAETGAIKRPITMANSYALPYDPSDLNWSSAGKNLYTRNGGSNQQYLQEKLASLEGGEDCVVLASGVAALSGLFFALLESGDHVVFSSVTYIAVYRLLNELLKNKFHVDTTIVDTSDLEAVKKAIRPNTKLVHIETPGNPTLTISDIRAIADISHENGALLSVDNTFASPYNQRPIELGADFTVESLTKYINGHGDAMGGAIIGKKKYLDIIRAQSQVNLGATISPFNAWLIHAWCSYPAPADAAAQCQRIAGGKVPSDGKGGQLCGIPRTGNSQGTRDRRRTDARRFRRRAVLWAACRSRYL